VVPTGPAVSTDQADYAPGDTVTIRGTGWLPGETVQMTLNEDPADSLHPATQLSAVADSTGSFVNRGFSPDTRHLGVTFTLAATGQTSGLTAQTTFTDGTLQLQNPPTIVKPTPNPFSPNSDGVRDVLTIGFRVTGSGAETNVQISVRPGSTIVGAADTVFSLGSLSPGAGGTRTWGGRNTSNVVRPDGVYTIRMFSTAQSEATANGARIETITLDNTPPVVSGVTATPNPATAPASVQLTATATDALSNVTGADYQINGGAWLPMSAVNAPFDNNTEAVQAALSSLAAATYQICVRARDEAGNTSAGATCTTLVVNTPKNPPTADAGGGSNALYSGTEGSNISLSGTATGTGLTYQWSVSPAGTCSFTGGNTLTPTVKCTDNGSFQLTLTVTDGDGETASDNATLNVSNVAPTAIVGGATSGKEGDNLSLTGSQTDPGTDDSFTYAWSIDYAASTLDPGTTCSIGPATSQNVTLNCNDDGSVVVKLTVTDDDGDSGNAQVPVALSNVAPAAQAQAGGAYKGTEGTSNSISLNGAVTDAGANDLGSMKFKWTYSSAGLDAGTVCSFSDDTDEDPTFACNDDGAVQITLMVDDQDGGIHSDQATVTLDNAKPIATPDYPASDVPEGTTFLLSLTNPSDASSNDVTAGFRYAFDCGDASSPALPTTYAAAGTNGSVSCATADNADRAVVGRIFDKDDGFTDYTATVKVVNVTPSVSITAPANYSVWAITAPELSDLGFVTAPFTDPGTADTHTCSISWGEGTTNSGAVTESSGNGTCKSYAANPYTTDGAGIYDITVKVKDDDQAEGTAAVTIVVYDPSAGFVTGGGWINSPKGACHTVACTDDTDGKANFGFVSKYQKGASVPTGQTEFQFQSGDLNFHSGVYEWLVVNQAGTNAQYKGTGTINGQSCGADFQGKCRFMLWATDGTKNGGYDTFRISIWTENSGGNKTPVYDNGSGSGFSTAAIGGGSIQVQTGKK
jgi:hypothetical protein